MRQVGPAIEAKVIQDELATALLCQRSDLKHLLRAVDRARYPSQQFVLINELKVDWELLVLDGVTADDIGHFFPKFNRTKKVVFVVTTNKKTFKLTYRAAFLEAMQGWNELEVSEQVWGVGQHVGVVPSKTIILVE